MIDYKQRKISEIMTVIIHHRQHLRPLIWLQAIINLLPDTINIRKNISTLIVHGGIETIQEIANVDILDMIQTGKAREEEKMIDRGEEVLVESAVIATHQGRREAVVRIEGIEVELLLQNHVPIIGLHGLQPKIKRRKCQLVIFLLNILGSNLFTHTRKNV